ncbi:HIT family protein [Stenotrophomonas sp. LARHCG68]
MSSVHMTDACRFCSIGAKASTASLVDKPWLEDDHYYAIASIGALVPGWSLIVPKKHSYNLVDHLENADFYKFVEAAVSRIESMYGPVLAFEHGSIAADSATSCGTAHAHLHLVPLSFALADAAVEADSSLAWDTVRLADLAQVVGGNEYLFVADRYNGRETTGLVTTLQAGRSQFFRRIIASHLGCPDEYDYKEFPRLEIAASTAISLSHDVGLISRVA